MADKDARDDNDSFMEIIREYPAVYSRVAVPSLFKIVHFDRSFFLIAFFPLVRGQSFITLGTGAGYTLQKWLKVLYPFTFCLKVFTPY